MSQNPEGRVVEVVLWPSTSHLTSLGFHPSCEMKLWDPKSICSCLHHDSGQKLRGFIEVASEEDTEGRLRRQVRKERGTKVGGSRGVGGKKASVTGTSIHKEQKDEAEGGVTAFRHHKPSCLHPVTGHDSKAENTMRKWWHHSKHFSQFLSNIKWFKFYLHI